MVEIKKIFEKYGINIENDEFYEDLSILLESTILERVNDRVNEELERKLEEYKEEIINQLDEYSREAIEEFINEHYDEIENNIKYELAENFLESISNTLINENFKIPENNEILEDYKERIEDIHEELISLNERIHELEIESLEKEKAIYFLKNSNDLTEIQKEKLSSVLETMNFNSIGDFERSFNLLKENILSSKNKERINEDFEDEFEDYRNNNEENKETKARKYLKYFYE